MCSISYFDVTVSIEHSCVFYIIYHTLVVKASLTLTFESGKSTTNDNQGRW